MNDYSACVTALVRGREVYVLDVWRGQVLLNDLLRKVADLAERWSVDTLLVEDAASGTALIQLLRARPLPHVPRPIAITPKMDKATRLSQASPRIEAGEVLLPVEEPWLADFERELLGFPNARTDDQVDALTQLLKWHIERRPDSIIVGPMSITWDPETGHCERSGDAWLISRSDPDDGDGDRDDSGMTRYW